MKRFRDILPAVLSVLFLMGILFVFHPCGPKEDGTWMSCHWAGVAETVCAALMTVLSLLRLALPSPKAKNVLSGLTILSAAAAAVHDGRHALPGHHASGCDRVFGADHSDGSVEYSAFA